MTSAHQPDLEWLGLEEVGPARWRFELVTALSRLDGRFYGGTGVAVATATMEAVTGRRALWTTVQFVSSGTVGDHFECHVEVLAEGRTASQVRMTGWKGDRLVWSGMGAASEPRRGPLEIQFGRMPEVPAPADCPRWVPLPFLADPSARPGWLAATEPRVASDAALWLRFDDRSLTRAGMGFLADVVPSGVVRAAGRRGAGTSLDNTIRFGPEPDGEWMLAEVEPHVISDGYLHGAARLWSAGGSLLGVASQTAGLLLFD
jgi:acyl-CoA thioesterase